MGQVATPSNHTGQASSLKPSKDKISTLFSQTSDLPVQPLALLPQLVELLLQKHQRRKRRRRKSQRRMSTWVVSSGTTSTECCETQVRFLRHNRFTEGEDA